MKINEIEKAVGLSAEAIRFYENKGLISTKRQENSYRVYDEDTIEQLKEIKLYRELGFSISELKLIKDGVVPTIEVLNKRLSELKKEEESMKNQYLVLNKMIDAIVFDRGRLNSDEFLELFENSYDNDESLERERFQEGIRSGILVVGIDIGTTTICASVVNGENGNLVDVYTLANDTFISTQHEFEYIQDVSAITKRATDLLDSILNSYPNVRAIGVTGQMHGIVYINPEGEAVSPLFTWQDRRGDLNYKGGMSYCEYINKVTQYQTAAGFGLVTHFYNQVNCLLPKDMSKMCTVMDYLTMKLTGRKTPLAHASNAASMGCFDIQNGAFDMKAIKSSGIDTETIPFVTDKFEMVSKYKGVPVAVAIGDNQASFLGSVSEPNQSVLVNIGTGSQISIMTEKSVCHGLDVRPYMLDQYLLVGSSLCGGKAYAILEKFFRSIAISAGAQDKPLYNMMNQLAERAFDSGDHLEVSTLFCGTRANPTTRGSIKNISGYNLTPEGMIYGTLCGIVDELYGFYKEFKGFIDEKPKYIIASGNGVRRNKAMQRILSETFKMDVLIPEHSEEAAFGAALFALVSLEGGSNTQEFTKFIKYK